jgi:hypothetical protein
MDVNFKEIVYVYNPVMNNAIKSFITYTVFVKNMMEQPIVRRYSDFFALRAKLVEKWPGVYIPNIPPKQTIVILKLTQGHMEKSVIDMRTKLLNTFFIKLSKFPFIFNSLEMSMFLNAKVDSKTLNSLPIGSYEEMSLRYESAFPDCYEVNIFIKSRFMIVSQSKL